MKCPACHKGNLWVDMNPYHLRNLGEMHSSCPHCKRDLRVEPGFYFGAAFVSYAMMVLIDILLAIAFYLITGSLFDQAIAFITTVIAFTLLIATVIFRYSRVIWLYLFVKYKGENQ